MPQSLLRYNRLRVMSPSGPCTVLELPSPQWEQSQQTELLDDRPPELQAEPTYFLKGPQSLTFNYSNRK